MRRGAAGFAGLLVGFCIAAGDPAALIWAALLLVGIGWLATIVAPAERRRDVVALALCALALHLAVGSGIHAVASTFSSGFITGDDANYFRLASAFARNLQGLPADPSYAPPLWGGDAYLLGAFVYLEVALFLIFGPDVLIPILLNSALAVVTALLIYDLTRRLFRDASGLLAAAIVAFFPSLTLWSGLNLKDALTTVVATLAVWAAVRFQLRPRALSYTAQFAAAELLISLRSYVAATMAITALVSIALATQVPVRRVVTVGVAAALTGIILLQTLSALGGGGGGGEDALVALERERAAMAVGAQTGFGPTPAPAAARPDTAVPAVGRTLNYLPTGLAYALFAPAPLFARRPQEVLAAPEMLGWYVLVVAGSATLWRERRRWTYLAPLALAIGGLMLVLALAEGNVGTLFRHRAMVIPFAAALAGPTLVALWHGRARAAPVELRGRHLLVADAAVMTAVYVLAARAMQLPPEVLWALPPIVLVRLAALVLGGSYRHEGRLAGTTELRRLASRFVLGDVLAYAGLALLGAVGLAAFSAGLAILDSILALGALVLYRLALAALGVGRHVLLGSDAGSPDIEALPAELRGMLDAFRSAPPVFQPSRFWEALNARHLRVLATDEGLATFKRTLNTSYFQFGLPAFLGALPILAWSWLRHPDPAVFLARAETGERRVPRALAIATALYANAVRHRRCGDLLDRLDEPALGAPLRVRYGRRSLTEDLCHSVEEYASVVSGLPAWIQPHRVLEIGAGYGRLAYAFVSARPDLQYYVVDIPPALYVSQRYLSEVLPDVAVFPFRPFRDHAEVAAAMAGARIVFLEPQQLELLPPDHLDVVLTVSTLHEMRADQVANYLAQVDRLCRGAFYTKQWRRFFNDVDGITASADGQRLPARWQPVFERSPLVPRSFVEALYVRRNGT